MVSDHGEVGRRIAGIANAEGARLIVIGSPAGPDGADLFDIALSQQLLGHARCDIYVLRPRPDGLTVPTPPSLTIDVPI